MTERTKEKIRIHFLSSTLPALIFGAISGILAGAAVTLYKFFAKYAVSLSEGLFLFLKLSPWFLLPILLLLFGVSVLLSRIYRREPDLQGGGIPASVGTLRGLFSFRWLKNTLGSFFLSLLSFLFGVPLGTEGPSVQIGTSLGAGAVRLSPKKYHAWERFSMTGGASAGFSVATGAPLAGIFFAIEEAHQRISPLIVLTSVVSVLAAGIVSHLLSPLLGVEVALFSIEDLPVLSLSSLWIPLLAGLVMGLFAVGFLRFYSFLDTLWRKKLGKVRSSLKIFSVFVLTLIAGLISPHFISTGHHMITSFFTASPGLLLILVIVVVRSFLSLSANISGITGGIFLPLLAIGSAVGAILAQILTFLGMKEDYMPLFLCFGILGCIAGMMKMPLTAILFAVEALGLSENLLPAILVCALSYAIPEALGEESVGERVLERRKEALIRKGSFTEREEEILIGEDAFAVGKEIRDIFWPDGTRVLSVKKTDPDSPLLSPGDVLLIRLKTYDEKKTLEELSTICRKSES